MRFVAETGAYQVVFYDDSLDLVSAIYDEKKEPKKPKCDTPRPGTPDLACLEAPKIVTTKIRFDSATAIPVPGGNLAGLANYMIPAGTFIGVERRDEITYPGIYPGIDLRFKFDEDGLLKFDVVVAPGADPGQFGLRATEGAKFEIAPDGGFAILSDAGIYRQAKPVVIPDDASTPPEASFYLDHKILRVALDGPAPTSGYVIDPGIEFVSYSAASAPVFSIDYSNVNIGNGEFITVGPYTPAFGAEPLNVRVTKWNKDGTVDEGVFGGSGDEIAAQIAYGEAGGVKKLAVAGWTNSADFPLLNEIQPALQGGGDGFITRIDFDTLVPELLTEPGRFSTYFGGNSPIGGTQSARDENAHSIEFAPGSIEKLYVAGLTDSQDFPTANPYQGANRGGRDAWFAEIDINGGSPVLNMSSYLGGSDDEDFDARLRVSPSTGNLWIDGTTWSGDFFVTTPPSGFQLTKGAGADGFLAEFSPNASAPPTLIGGTFVGGDGDDVIYDLAIRPESDQAVISMKTGSTGLVTTDYAYSPNYSGNDDVFVLEAGPAAGSRVFATYVGGPNFDFAVGVAALPGNRIAIGAGADGLRPGDAGGFPYKNPEAPPAPAVENFIGSNAVNPTVLVLDTTKTGADQLEFSRCLAAKNAWPEELNYADGKIAVTGQRVNWSFGGTSVVSDLPTYNPPPAYDPYHPDNTSPFAGFSWVLDESSYDPFAIRRQTGDILATSGQPIVIEADIAGSPSEPVKIEFTPDGGTPQISYMAQAGPPRPGIWSGSFAIGTQPGTVRVIAKDGFCEVTRAASRVELVNDAITGRITGDDPASAKPPMAGAHVVAQDQGTGLIYDAFTDQDGYYVIRPVPPGSYTLTVSPVNTPGSNDGWADGYSEGKTSLQEVLAFDAPSFNDELLQRAGTICGVITGEDTAGAPLAGGINATFYNRFTSNTVGGSVESDPVTGQYCKWLPDGEYYALYNSPTSTKKLGWNLYSPVWSPPDQLFDPANGGGFSWFNVDPGQGITYDPQLRRTWDVTGSVRREGDAPGPGMAGSYWAISPNGQYWAVDVPNSGDFSYPLPNGDWWLVFVYSGCDVLFYNNKTEPPLDTVTVSGADVPLSNIQNLSCPP